MTPENTRRLIEFLRRKMCKPCRDSGANPEHPACCEAADLIDIVEQEA
jgi:hypothetical protein